MLAAKWDNTNAPPSYWAAQLRKVRNASPWVFAIALLPTGLYLFQLLIGHKATLTPLPFVFLTMIPMFIREIPRKLALPEKLESIFVRHYNDAIPCDITI